MSAVLAYVRDGLNNLVSRMGTDRDKAAASAYVLNTLTDDQIIAAYKTAWLPRKIVDIPAFDSVRAWRDWQATGDQIEKIEAEEKRLGLKGKVLAARIRARLWGGAAIIIGTGESNLAEELNPERIKTGGIKYLTVVTRRNLAAGEIDRDAASEYYGKPKHYTVTSGQQVQVEIHPSRLVLFHGNEQPDDDLGMGNQGWGDPVLTSTLDAIKQADATAANIASLVFEAKIDIFKIPNFMANIGSKDYEDKIVARYTLANMGKGINGALMMDAEEEYEQKSANFATLPDILDRFLQIVSGAADIPSTRLLGQSPAGMNATGESDLRNYYDRLSAMQEIEMTPAMQRLDECLIRSALGSRDQSIYYNWRSLWQMSEKEKADVFKTKADAARVIAGNGGTSEPLMPIEALSDALVNELIEDGSLSGLEAAIEEYGKLSEQVEDPAQVEAAMVPPDPSQTPPASPAVAANDASPRTLCISRKLLNAADVIAWAKAQGFETTLPAGDLHVTVIHTRAPMDWIKVGNAGEWSSESDGKMEVAPGGPRLMERFGDAVVLQFASSRLAWRHEDIVRLGAEVDHPEYQPHVTISYSFNGDLSKVEPYQGKLVFGPEVFAEVKEDWAAGLTEE